MRKGNVGTLNDPVLTILTPVGGIVYKQTIFLVSAAAFVQLVSRSNYADRGHLPIFHCDNKSHYPVDY